MSAILDEVQKALSADKVLITDVTTESQYVLAYTGAPLPAEFAGAMPLSHSICQHTIGMRFPLTIENAASHPLLSGCLAIPDLNIGAYIGAPFGPLMPSLALCAVCHKPTAWLAQHRSSLHSAIDEILVNHLDELSELQRLARRR